MTTCRDSIASVHFPFIPAFWAVSKLQHPKISLHLIAASLQTISLYLNQRFMCRFMGLNTQKRKFPFSESACIQMCEPATYISSYHWNTDQQICARCVIKASLWPSQVLSFRCLPVGFKTKYEPITCTLFLSTIQKKEVATLALCVRNRSHTVYSYSARGLAI